MVVVAMTVEVAKGNLGARARARARVGVKARVEMLAAELVVEIAEGGRRAWVAGSGAMVVPGAQCLLTPPPLLPGGALDTKSFPPEEKEGPRASSFS